MTDQLLFELEETGVATITLNRPEKMNAYTEEMFAEWLTVLERCNRDPAVRVVIITGTGRGFTTGGDVSTFGDKANQSPARIKGTLQESSQRLPLAIYELQKPVIAAMNGVATGGGLDIALACDIRFAAESARFAETYVRMGLIPGQGGAFFLPRIVGMAKALELLWTADWVDAREAERIGLISRVCPDVELLNTTLEFARRIAAGAPLSVQLIKRVLRQGLDQDLRASLELVAANMPIVRTSEDHKEAVKAFNEKRTPTFKGQ